MPSPLEERLKALDSKLAKTQKGEEEEPASGMALALRMGSEMVAAVLVGAGCGYFLDSFLGSLPLFLILFLFIGAIAGIRMMIQTSNRHSEQLDNQTVRENGQ